jgi:hypothetical protein
MRSERRVGVVHTCTHGAGPAAAGERANSPRRPAECYARYDCAWDTTPQHSGCRVVLRASIQAACSEYRLSCMALMRGESHLSSARAALVADVGWDGSPGGCCVLGASCHVDV